MTLSAGSVPLALFCAVVCLAGCVEPAAEPEPTAPVPADPATVTAERSFRASGDLPWEHQGPGVGIYLNQGAEPHFVVPGNATVLAFDVEASADASLVDRPVRFRALCQAPETARGCDDGGLLAEAEGTLPLGLEVSDVAVPEHHMLVFEVVTDDPVAPFTMAEYMVEGILVVETLAGATA